MDTIVFDIETQNFFTDSGVGRDNFGALKISVVCAYSYMRNGFFSFEEHEMAGAAELFAGADTLVGFSINRYDIPVLNNYFQKLRLPIGNLWGKTRIDLLEEIELATQQRTSLSRLAEANLGVKKEHHSAEAITLYNEGRMDELKEYCLNDVELTKALYDLYCAQNYLMVPNKLTGETVKVSFAKPFTGAGHATP